MFAWGYSFECPLLTLMDVGLDLMHCKLVYSLRLLIAGKLMLQFSSTTLIENLQFSVMNVSVRATMKGAAKCDKHCELQNSVNRQGLERILCFWDIPESMPASVSMLYCSNSSATPGTAVVSACASRCTPRCSWGIQLTRLRCDRQLTEHLSCFLFAVRVVVV